MKLAQLQEARYYREKDKYVCPECKGSGESGKVFQSPITQNRMRKGCKYCDGRGYLKQRDIDQKRNPPKLKLMREARYVGGFVDTPWYVLFDGPAQKFISEIGRAGNVEHTDTYSNQTRFMTFESKEKAQAYIDEAKQFAYIEYLSDDARPRTGHNASRILDKVRKNIKYIKNIQVVKLGAKVI